MITHLAKVIFAKLTKKGDAQNFSIGRLLVPDALKRAKSFAFYLLILLTVSKAQAAVLVEYAVSSGNSVSATTTASNTTSTSMSRSSQVVAPGSPCSFGVSSTSSGTGFVSASLNSNAYLTFTTKPNACYSLSLSSLNVGVRSSGTGPTQCRIDYSLDGGTTWITGKSAFTPSTSGCQTSTTFNSLGNFSFPSSTNADYINGIIVKIYAWGASGSSGTFQLYQLDLNGTVNSAPPTPAVTGTLTACVGSKLVYRTAKVTGDAYAWTSTGGTVSGNSSNDSFVVTWGSTGTYSIKVVETNTTGGCKDSSTKTVVVNARPTPAIVTSDTVLCTGTTGTYKTTSVSGNTYKWTATGGNVTSGAGTATVVVTWTTASINNKIKVVETNANGCKDSSTKTVNVSRPTPAITGDANVCVGSSGTYKVSNVSGDTYSWTSTGGSISSGSGTNAISISWSSAGTYSVKVVEKNINGCKDSSTFSVKVGSPTPAISGDTAVCSASNGTYKTTVVTGNTYKWTSTSGTITSGAGTGTININWPSTGTYTVKVVETNPLGGCKDSSTMSVHILGRPSPLVISTDTILCTNISGVYKTANVSGDTYKWTAVSGTISSGATTETATISWATSGTFTAKVVETNSRGCKDSSTKTVKASRPKPVMTANLAVCKGNSGAYSVTNVSGDTYVWSSTGGSITSGAGTSAINISWPVSGTYSVKVVETNTNGCKDSATVSVVVSRPTPVVITSDTIPCTGTVGTYKTTSVSGDTYKWTATGGTVTSGAGTATITVSWPTAGAYAVKVVETNASGCKDSNTVTVKVSRPKPVVSGDASVCTGLSGNYKTTAVSGDTYKWTSTSGTITSGAGTENINISWPTAGTFTVKVVETNPVGCKDSSTFTVKVSRPTPVNTGDTVVCAGANGTYKTPAATGDTYKWTSTGGSITSGAGTISIVNNWPTAGNYSVKVVETNTSGCKDSSSINVRVIARPTPSISGDAIICTGTSGTYKTAAVSGITYKWTTTSGTITSGAGTEQVTVSWPTAGTFSVKVVEINANGCKDSNTFSVNVSRPKPVMTANLIICTGNSGTYKVTSISGDTYSWTTTGGSVTSGAGTASINVNWPTAGSYTVKVVETNTNGCKDSAAVIVNVSRPTPIVISSDSIICTGNSGSYKTSAISGDTYKWTAIGGTVTAGAGTEAVTINWPTAGVYTVKVVETNTNGCKDSSVFIVKVSRPTPSISGDASVCTGTNGTYKTASASGDTYTWTTNSGTITSGAGTEVITVNWPTAGTYKVTVVETNIYGCKDSNSFTVKISRPTPVASGDSIICTGNSGTYHTSAVSGDTYSWTTTSGTITSGAGTEAITVNWPTSGTFKAKVVETNTDGCKDSSNFTVKVNRPTPSVIGDSIICTGNNGSYKTASASGDTYSWTSTGGTISSGSGTSVIAIKWPTAGTYSVKVVETNIYGCKDSSTITVKVGRPTPVVIGDSLVCKGSATTYKTTAASGDTYKWSTTGGTLTSGAGTENVTISWPTSGFYTVKVVETNIYGCKDSSSIKVHVNSPTPGVSGDSIICTGNNGTYKTTGSSGSSYSWTAIGGTISSGSGTNTISVKWPTTGIYTVKVVETNINGCKDSSTFKVKVARPTPSIIGDANVCGGSTGSYKTTSVSGNTYKWSSTGGTISSGAGSASIGIYWKDSGTYFVKVVETNAYGCKDSNTISVRIGKPAPSVSGDAIICTGTTGTYKTPGISGNTYKWSTTGGSISSGSGTGTITISWPTAGTYVVKVVETNSGGCADSSTISVNVSRPKPAIIVSSSDTILCTGTSGNYKTTSVSGNTYKWTATGGSITSGTGTASIVVNWPTSGTYKVKVVETNANGCKDSSTVNVNVNRPKPSITGDAIICTNTTGNYKTTSVSGNTYKWTTTSGSITSGTGTASISVSWPTVGTYTVKVVETNINGCKDSNTFSVNVSRPTPSIIGDAIVCTNTTGNYKTTSVSGNTYKWTTTSGSISNGAGTASISVSWPSAGTYTVKVVETNTNGCKDSNTFSVNVSRPTPSITGDAIVCTNTTGNYKTTSVSGNTYKWTTTSGSISSGSGTASISVSWPTAGTYTVKVVETNTNGCKDSNIFTVNVSRPTPSITGDAVVCTGNTGNYKTTSVSGNTYKWTTTSGTVTSGAGTASISVSWPTAGTYTVKVVETNTNGCKDSNTFTVNISRPTPAISGDASVCTNTTGNYKTASVSGDTYKWTTTSGTITSGSGTASISVSWPTSGTYTVKVVETNTNGCKDSNTFTVNVSRPKPVVTVSSSDTIVCTNNSGSYKTSSVSGDTYNWTATGGTVTSGAGTASIIVKWPTAGTYKVKVVETNASGCKDSSTVTVRVSRPTPSASGDLNVCTGTSGNYKLTTVSGNTYKWSTTSGTITSGAGTGAITVSWPTAGTYTVKVVETNPSGCKDSSTLTVNVNRPTPKVSGDTTICTGNDGAYSTAGASGDSYKWTTTSGTVTSGAGTSAITVNWPKAGTYTVKVVETNTNGCKDSSSIIVKINRPTPVVHGDSNVCTATTGAYRVTNISGDTYKWRAVGGTITSGANTSSIVVSWPSAGTYNVKLVQTNMNGCKDSSTMIVNVGRPSPAPSGDSIVCAGTFGSYKTTSVSGDSYKWVATGGTVTSGAGTSSIIVKWPNSGTYTVKLIETNFAGCKDSSIFTVKVSKPAPKITGDTLACTGSNGAYKTTKVAGNQYQWSAVGGTVNSGATTSSATVNWPKAGTYSVKVVETNASGCKDSSIVTVKVSKPAPTITGNTVICAGLSSAYSVTAVAGDKYSWTVTGGTITSGGGTNAINASFPGNGTYKVKVVQSNVGGCKDSSIVTVSIDIPTPTVKGNTNVCTGTIASYKATKVSGHAYIWVVTGGTVVTGANTDSVTINWPTPGAYTVKLIEASGTGCKDSNTLNVSVNWPTPVIIGDTDVCPNTPTTYRTAAVSGDLYLWTINGGVISSGAGTESVTVSWTSFGARSITVKETNKQGCSANSTLKVNVSTAPNAAWVSTNPSGRTFNFIASDKSNTSYTWDFGDSNADTGSTVSHTYAVNGNYNVKLTVRNKKGCLASYTASVNASSTGINTPAQQNIGLSVYPNPFTNETNIAYTLDNNAQVSLRIFNVDGRLVQVIDEGNQIAGDHHYTIIGDNKLPAGVYILQMTADRQNIIRRIVRLQ